MILQKNQEVQINSQTVWRWEVCSILSSSHELWMEFNAQESKKVIIANPRKFSRAHPIGLFFINFEATAWNTRKNNRTVNLSGIQRFTRSNAVIGKHSDWNSLSPQMGSQRFKKLCANKRCTRKPKGRTVKWKFLTYPAPKSHENIYSQIFVIDRKKYQNCDSLLSNQKKKDNNCWTRHSWWYATPDT